MKTIAPNLIVGIGGSAGGLQAYMDFLDALPPNTGMSFVIVCHLMPAANSQLAEILSRRTKMPVKVVLQTMPILANHVYVIPPNADLFIEGANLKVVVPRSARNKQIDVFLTSLAEVMGERAIAIIFSGADGDGTEGCRKIKEKGGTTFAQDGTAEVVAMPLSAMASGCIDFVLAPDKIPAQLLKIAKRFK